jgi:hypothetical protein
VYLRSRIGQGRLRSYLEPTSSVSMPYPRPERIRIRGGCIPPGAVGGRYGSGCFHFSSRASVSLISSCSRALAGSYKAARGVRGGSGQTHPLLSRLCNVLVGFKQSAQIQSLSAPEVSVDGPVEGQLEGPPVEASVQRQWLRVAGGTGAAHRTWMRALMATRAVVCVGRGGVGGGARPQCVVVEAGSVVSELRGSLGLARGAATEAV